MAKGFMKDNKFRPIGNKRINSSIKRTVTPSGMLIEFKEVKPPNIIEHKVRGEVQGTIEVDGHEVEFGDEGEEDAISDFRDDNELWTEVKVTKNQEITVEGEKLEEGMKEWGATEVPNGSVYLTRDGIWIGGEGVLGYDEDHRPQIRMGLRRAGIKIITDDDDFSGSSEMVDALMLSGMIRAGIRGDSMSLDVFHPVSREQKNAIQDEMISRKVSPIDLVIDANQKGEVVEERIRRMFDELEEF